MLKIQDAYCYIYMSCYICLVTCNAYVYAKFLGMGNNMPDVRRGSRAIWSCQRPKYNGSVQRIEY